MGADTLTAALIALLPLYGAALVGVVAYLACLILPLPAALVLIGAGAMSTLGPPPLMLVLATGMAGAVMGDLTGFALGGRMKPVLLRLKARKGARGAAVSRAMALTRAQGASAVFLSRWALAPLGPWVNFAAGAARMPRTRFVTAMIVGRAIWVGGYVGLGAMFADDVGAALQVAGRTGGIVLGTLAVLLAIYLARRALAALWTGHARKTVDGGAKAPDGGAGPRNDHHSD
jgi:membrane protein DedA with SNARE-associated domain